VRAAVRAAGRPGGSGRPELAALSGFIYRSPRMLPAPRRLCTWAALALALPAAAWAQASKAPIPATSGQGAAAPSAAAAPEDPAARRERMKALLDDPDLNQARPPAHEEHEVGAGIYLQSFVALGVVILLVYLTLNFGLRRLMGVRGVTGAPVVTVVQRIPLDQKKAMFVLQAAGEYLLVGGADGALSLICKLDREQVERIQQERAVPQMALTPFLQKLLSRKGGPPAAAG